MLYLFIPVDGYSSLPNCGYNRFFTVSKSEDEGWITINELTCTFFLFHVLSHALLTIFLCTPFSNCRKILYFFSCWLMFCVISDSYISCSFLLFLIAPDWKNAYTVQTLRKLNCWKAMFYFYKSGCFQSLNVLVMLFLGLGILNGNWPFSTRFCQVDFSFYRSRCFLVSLFSPKHEAVTNTYKSTFTFAFHLCCTLQCFIALSSHPGLSFFKPNLHTTKLIQRNFF